MPGVWVFPGGAVDAADGEGEDGAPRLRRARARRRRPGSSCRARPSWSRSRAGSRPRSSRSASTPASTSPSRRPHSPPKPDGAEIVDAGWFSPARPLDAPRRRRAAARLPDDQAARGAARPTPAPRRRSRPPASATVEPILPKRRSATARSTASSCCRATPATERAPRPPRLAFGRDRHPAPGGPRGLRPLHHHRVHDDRRPAAADRLAGDALLPRTAARRSTSRPASATRRRPTTPSATRSVALLFSDPTGSGIDERHPRSSSRAPPRSTTRDLDANRERYWRESAREAARRPRRCTRRSSSRGMFELVLRAHLRQGAPRAGLRLARRRRRSEPEIHDSHIEEVRSGHIEEPAEPHAPAEPAAGRLGRRASRSSASRYPTAVLAWVAPDGFPLAARVPVALDRAAQRGSGSDRARRPAARCRAAPASPPTPTAPTSSGRRTSRCAATWCGTGGRLGARPAQAGRRLRAARRRAQLASATGATSASRSASTAPAAGAASERRPSAELPASGNGSSPACQGPAG